MAVPSTPLTIDITNSDRVGLLYSFDARNLISSPLFVRNDGNPIALRLCRPSTSGVRVFDDFDPTDYTVSLAIGEPDEVPTAGTWQLTSGANTTAALAANISATDLQTALNLLSGVDVTVASSAPGLFVVTFTTLGAQTLLTAPANSLNPTSNVIVSRVVTGTASTYEVQVVRQVLVPYALNETWTPFASADSDIATLVEGDSDTYQVDVITLDPRPYAGTFTIDGSDPIAYNATAAQVQAALGDCTVSGNQGGPWTITSTVFGAISRTVDVAGLTVPIGLDGTLNLNTYSMLQRFLQTTDSIITLTQEVQLRSTVPGSKPFTVMQIPVRVSRDVIDTDSLLPAPVGDYYTAAEVDTLLAEKADKPAYVASNTTAEFGGTYEVFASATFTDPTPPGEGGYIVRVRNGTATIGGEAYTEGQWWRVWHSGSWTTMRIGFTAPTPAAARAALGVAYATSDETITGIVGDKVVAPDTLKAALDPRVAGTLAAASLSFGGSGQALFSSAALRAGSLTLNALVTFKTGGSVQTVVGGTFDSFGFRALADGRCGATRTNTADAGVFPVGTMPFGRPVIVTYTKRAEAGEADLYLDGNYVGTVADTLDYTVGSGLLGASVFADNPLIGRLARTTLQNRSMSASEVSELFRNLGVLPPELQHGSMTPIAAGGFVVGRRYRIVTLGTTDFTLVGASANTVGVEFAATGAGTGTGTAITLGALYIQPDADKGAGPVLRAPYGLPDTVLPGDGHTSGGVVRSMAGERGVITYTRTSSGYLIDDVPIIPEGYAIEAVSFVGDGTVTLGESSVTPANVVAAATASANPPPVAPLVGTTSNRKLYLVLGTATTCTVHVSIVRR